MLSLNTPTYSPPAGYQVSELPKPVLRDGNEVLIKVHAASINPVDVKKASGILKRGMKDDFPFKIGYDCAGVVAEVGSGVSRVKVGDEVYTRLPEAFRGACSEFVTCPDRDVARKPRSLSFDEAASIPLAAITALQALRRYEGDLTGKIVLVPAGLSGTGLFACQLAKHVFKVGKVITTVSTSKVPKVKELLGENTVDEIIDYTTVDPKTAIVQGTIDFLLDTIGCSMEYLSLMRPKTGCIISISTTPSGDQLQNSTLMELPHRPALPLPIKLALNFMDSIRKFRARRYGVSYSFMFLEGSGEDLDELRDHVETGKLRTVVGMTAPLKDLKAVQEACQVVYSGRGGLGKVVIKVVDE